LAGVTIVLADLDAGALGEAAGTTVRIDRTAAGWGWTFDGQRAAGRMALLAALIHEFGHVLGFEHADDGVMAAQLAALAPAHPVVASAPVPAGRPAVAARGRMRVTAVGPAMAASAGSTLPPAVPVGVLAVAHLTVRVSCGPARAFVADTPAPVVFGRQVSWARVLAGVMWWWARSSARMAS
jgi:hypothetical protein